MIKNFVKILELLGDRLEVCVSVHNIMPSQKWQLYIVTILFIQESLSKM